MSKPAYIVVPEEIRMMLRGTKLKTEEEIQQFWNRPHPMLSLLGNTPHLTWNAGNKLMVKAFIEILKSGDGSMT